MLREIIDIASLEDFVSGLARIARLRVCVYDSRGELIVASYSNNDFARLTGHVLRLLPANMQMTRVPAHDPPGHVAFVETQGIWYIVAPIYLEDGQAGFISVGEFRDTRPALDTWKPATNRRGIDETALLRAWESLPPLDRSGQSHPVITVRWAARQAAEWCRREARLDSAQDEIALVGDIAELLTGEQDVQKILDRIVAETARVMRCPACSMRLYDENTHELRIQAVYNLPTEAIGEPAFVRLSSALDDEALQGRVVYIEDVRTDPRVQDPESARRRGIVSVLAAGMVYRGRPVGVIRVYTRQRRRFRQAQRAMLHAVAQQAAAAIVHARLIEERLRAAETERQLTLAGELQARIIRTPPPEHPLIQAAMIFEPTYHLAGDFCDFLTLCDGRLGVVVADVVGKGIPASLLMTSVRGALRAAAEGCAGPAEIMHRLNRQIYRDTRPSEFVTLLLLAIDDDARRLTYCSAGHEPLLLLRDGEVTETEEADLVLGISGREVYHEHTVDLEPNDLLLLYTDGVCEARNFADEEFTRERVWAALRAYGHLPPKAALHNIRWDVRRFVGLADQSDDLTLVALRVLAKPAETAAAEVAPTVEPRTVPEVKP
jgi:sigma-B regulation protein RsbU (phosphoserine phosphatase)